ncbi:MAG: PIN domain-containing protein [Akkermansiaceae bacterium]
MGVIVDTSVWSLALQRRNPVNAPETEALTELIETGKAIMIGPVRQEILSGVRYTVQFDRLRSALSAFPDELLESSDFVEAARICNKCLDSGIVIGNTACLIAAIAIAREMEILTIDPEFEKLSSVVQIPLYQP